MSHKSKKRGIEQAFGPNDVPAKSEKKQKRQRGLTAQEDNSNGIIPETSTRVGAQNQDTAPSSPSADLTPKPASTSKKSKKRKRGGSLDFSKKVHAVSKTQENVEETRIDKSSDGKSHTPTNGARNRKAEVDFSKGTRAKAKKSRKRKERVSKGVKEAGDSLQKLQEKSFYCPIQSCSRNEQPLENRRSFNRHIQYEHTSAEFGGSQALQAALIPKDGGETQDKASSHQVNLVERSPLRAEKWSLSPAGSGRFINQDPLVSTDGKNLILPTKRSIQIYSTKTSLLLRSLLPNNKSDITCCCLDIENSTEILIGFENGCIQSWDWTKGQKLNVWQHMPSLTSLASQCGSKNSRTMLAVCRKDAKSSLTRLKLGDKGKIIKSQQLFEKEAQLAPVLLLLGDDNRIITICSTNSIVIGHRRDAAEDSESRDSYQWHEVNVTGTVVSYDARINTVRNTAANRLPVVDIALGLGNGEIHIHENVLANAIAADKGMKPDMKPRKMHWHRTAVNTVKWSRDGSYLISGGNETVLVIWQLDTNNKQFLPHLSTPILNVTVSRSGNAYAMRLADNSVMIISTADLKPSANVSGLAFSPNSVKAVLHPVNSNQLLLAVPSDSACTDRKSLCCPNLLQTYDIDSNIQLNRQALTRNLITTVRVRPDGRPIREPSVVQLSLSQDGKWLVTVDEWIPEDSEVKVLHGTGEEKQPEKETFLRFWTTSETDSYWELNTRIDGPVSTEFRSILALAMNPSKLQAVTVGSNGHVKLWTPKTRVRNGVAVKNSSGQPLFTWTCDQELAVASELAPADSAAVGFSEDGSVLAVTWSSTSKQGDRILYLIDPKSGSICQSVPGLVSSGNASLAFCGRYLTMVSNTFCIFDLVSLESVYILDIHRMYDQRKAILAANAIGGTVAIAANPSDTARQSQVLVFDLEAPGKGPLYETSVNGQISALLASPGHGGYVVIDDEARIRQLVPPGFVATSTAVQQQSEELKQGLDGIFGSTLALEAGPPVDKFEEPRLIEDGKQQTLEEVLNIQSTASAPSLRELFNSVARAVSTVFR